VKRLVEQKEEVKRLVEQKEEVKRLVEQKEEVAFSVSLVGCLGVDCLNLAGGTSQWRALGHKIIRHAMS
jgi:hypothetical protein